MDLALEVGGLRLSGRADLVGPGWVLDYKTDAEVAPADHALQLWAYASGLRKPEAYLTYLRQGQAIAVDGLEKEAELVVNGIQSMEFAPTPSKAGCRRCPYLPLCEEGRAVLEG